MLTDARWVKLFHLMKSTGRVYNKPEHRQTFEGILYQFLTGIPWRYLPKELGHWSTVFRWFYLWSKKGILAHLFNALTLLIWNGSLLMAR